MNFGATCYDLDSTVELSVVIPCLNDANTLKKTIPILRKHLQERVTNFEIILSDDGSRDGGVTHRLARKLGCLYVRSHCTQGKGSAVKKGILAAQGKYRVFTDSDLPYGVNAITDVLHELSQLQSDLVVGIRCDNQYRYSGQFWRRMASSLFRQFMKLLFTGPIDTQCGIKGFRAGVAEKLFSSSRIAQYAFDIEILYLARKWNYRTLSIPVILQSNGPSHVHLWRDGLILCRDLMRIATNAIFGRYQLPCDFTNQRTSA